MNISDSICVTPVSELNATIVAPGDKSISHRSVLLNSIAIGNAQIKGFVKGEDCLSTIKILQQLGCEIEQNDSEFSSTLNIKGLGLYGYAEPEDILNAGNSGTTVRLLSGLLSGRDFISIITGDSSLRKRPMKRIIDPMIEMGAIIYGRDKNNKLPIVFNGGNLHGIKYKMPVASAQLKSSLLLAGLRSKEKTEIIQPGISRNHTELMLQAMGAKIEINDKTIIIHPTSKINAIDMIIPGDISSASFWFVAGICHPKADLLIKNVGINKTRSGILKVLNSMGARIEIINQRNISGEDVADINVKSSQLKSTVIEGNIIPYLIDEIPVLCVAAAMAEGTTVIKDARELKFKETNRIDTSINWLKNAGINCDATDDGMIIEGSGKIQGGEFNSFGDHRIAMSIGIAGLFSDKPITVHESKSVDISYPNFWKEIVTISK